MVKEFYPGGVNNLLCWFHINQNAANKLSRFIRRCTKDEEFFICGQIRKLLPFLPEDSITQAYNQIKYKMEFMKKKYGFFVDNFKTFFIYLDAIYFGNTAKLPLLCKFEKIIRTTNLIESIHSSFKKSCF